MNLLTPIFRILVGGLFIISGFIKANDPLGFSYKLQEYFEVFGQYPVIRVFDHPFFAGAALELSIFICLLEIVLGLGLLIGAMPRLTATVTLLLIIFFTFLTGFSAVTGKVTDCGCFGDAVKLTPWESFYKDIVLLLFTGVIFARRNKIGPLFSARITKYIMAAGTAAILGFTLFCYHHLPMIDFRPYKTGNDICVLMELPEGAQAPVYETVLTCRDKSTGAISKHSMKEYMARPELWNDTVYECSSESRLISEGDKARIDNFRLEDEYGIDVTHDVLDEPGVKFFIIAYDIGQAARKHFGKIRELSSWAESAGVKFYGLSASADQEVEIFRHDVQAEFPFLTADAIELKTIIRSNPGIVMMKDCRIVGKWHWRDVPGVEEVRRIIGRSS